tara:strand:+ start:5566 stop:5766 length:201 start_codon:yes stop_codon:yes gene_type:complete
LAPQPELLCCRIDRPKSRVTSSGRAIFRRTVTLHDEALGQVLVATTTSDRECDVQPTGPAASATVL